MKTCNVKIKMDILNNIKIVEYADCKKFKLAVRKKSKKQNEEFIKV